MKILAVDYGHARTGIAVSDIGEFLASPVCVIEERNFDRLAEKIAEVYKNERAEMLVVGLPRNMDGSEGESAQNCRALAAALAESCETEPVLWDERRTTITAHNILNETNTRGKKRKAVVDAVAATVILESYLAFRKNSK